MSEEEEQLAIEQLAEDLLEAFCDARFICQKCGKSMKAEVPEDATIHTKVSYPQCCGTKTKIILAQDIN